MVIIIFIEIKKNKLKKNNKNNIFNNKKIAIININLFNNKF